MKFLFSCSDQTATRHVDLDGSGNETVCGLKAVGQPELHAEHDLEKQVNCPTCWKKDRELNTYRAEEILTRTNDGDDLTDAHLRLVEAAVNHNLNDAGHEYFVDLHAKVAAGTYKKDG